MSERERGLLQRTLQDVAAMRSEKSPEALLDLIDDAMDNLAALKELVSERLMMEVEDD